ncbi:MAG: N-hydroxyarylamine O-acetyltransferase [Polaribacter sp.]|jgi:N-hydroxyarylamine O-acetyltransferase
MFFGGRLAASLLLTFFYRNHAKSATDLLKMNINDYINRINYRGDLRPTLHALRGLQKAHLLNVPFENLAIHYGNSIDLDMDNIYHEIVVKGRGGFCYELNGVFDTLLKRLGFDSKIISARVYDNKKEDFGKEYDHLAIIVVLDNIKYLVDVGFGEFVFYPLKLEINKTQSDPRGDFVIEEYDNKYYQVSKIEGKTKSIEYIFSEKERAIDEFSGMCNYHQTSPDSHFTQKKLISKPTENGRITITGNTLKITKNGEIKENRPLKEGDYKKQLLRWFNIDEAKIRDSR